MTKLTAIALWPLVYLLDFGIYLTGAKTFKEARAISKAHFKRIMSRKGSVQSHRHGIMPEVATHND